MCRATFKVENGRCVKDYSGCISRSAKGDCQFCGFKTQLDGSKCVGVVNCR